VLAYLTNRAIMDRLDEVCGPGGWENRFEKAPNDPKGESLLCGIGVHVGELVIWKWDGANNTDVEPTKGGISDSMKRAAVQWGIGRYLYGLGESWADCTEEDKKGQDGWRYAKTKDGTFWWKPPALPAWATKAPSKADAKQAAIDASGGRLRPASELPPRNRPDGAVDPLDPPEEVRGSDGPHPWYCVALKALLRSCGANTAGEWRAMLGWALGVEVEDHRELVGDPAASQTAWQRLIDKNNAGVPFGRMLAEAAKPKAAQKQLVETSGYAG
jgi:hypothetical protein